MAGSSWAMCDWCKKRRPQWWAQLCWWYLGGVAGYWDYCSSTCAANHHYSKRSPY